MPRSDGDDASSLDGCYNRERDVGVHRRARLRRESLPRLRRRLSMLQRRILHSGRRPRRRTSQSRPRPRRRERLAIDEDAGGRPVTSAATGRWQARESRGRGCIDPNAHRVVARGAPRPRHAAGMSSKTRAGTTPAKRRTVTRRCHQRHRALALKACARHRSNSADPFITVNRKRASAGTDPAATAGMRCAGTCHHGVAVRRVPRRGSLGLHLHTPRRLRCPRWRRHGRAHGRQGAGSRAGARSPAASAAESLRHCRDLRCPGPMPTIPHAGQRANEAAMRFAHPADLSVQALRQQDPEGLGPDLRDPARPCDLTTTQVHAARHAGKKGLPDRAMDHAHVFLLIPAGQRSVPTRSASSNGDSDVRDSAAGNSGQR